MDPVGGSHYRLYSDILKTTVLHPYWSAIKEAALIDMPMQ